MLFNDIVINRMANFHIKDLLLVLDWTSGPELTILFQLNHGLLYIAVEHCWEAEQKRLGKAVYLVKQVNWT